MKKGIQIWEIYVGKREIKAVKSWKKSVKLLRNLNPE